MRICPIGEAERPRRTACSSSSRVRAMPPPHPPSVYAGRTTTGKPSWATICSASCCVETISLRGVVRPASAIVWRKRSRSSARAIASYARPDQLHAVALERAVLGQCLRQVQRRLAAERREQGVRLLLLDDRRDGVGQQRLDVGRVGELRVGHDRRRVRVDQHDLVALLAQDLAGLHAGVVELGGLADDDRPRPEDQDALDVRALRHQPAACGVASPASAAIWSTNRSKRYRESCGPGPASGWYWTVAPRASGSSSPSTVRS